MLATDPLVHGKNMINNWLWEQTNGVVQSGPFKDMVLLREESWEDGNSGTKILGCYECELHQPLEDEIKRLATKLMPKISNVGCAEGYYAVGMARRLPNAMVHIFDTSEDALRIAENAAAVNGVKVLPRTIDNTLFNPDLVIMDCEGGEQGYLDLERYPTLRRATIIVEIHEGDDGHAVNNLIAHRFQDTHEMFSCLAECAREPLAMPLLRKLSSHYRWLAVSEGRPMMMNYLIMRPR
jgi:hypothetical protein